MEVFQAFAIVGGTIVGAYGVFSIFPKITAPLLRTRDKIKKVNNIEKNYDDIKRHDKLINDLDARVGKLENYQSLNYNKIIQIDENVNLISRGVLALINNRLNDNSTDQLQSIKEDMESKRGFVK